MNGQLNTMGAAEGLHVDARIVRLAGKNKRVFELECGAGYLSASLRRQGCRVIATEADPYAAARASQVCERVIVGDIQHLDLERELGKEVFDVVVAAGVFEYLADPASLLTKLKPHIGSEGCVIASLPHARHASVRLAALGGESRAEGKGLYTTQSIYELFGKAGFGIGHLEWQTRAIDADVPDDLRRMAPSAIEMLADDPDARIYQFVVVAHPISGAMAAVVEHLRQYFAAGWEQAQRENAALREAVETLKQDYGQLSDQLDRLRSLRIEGGGERLHADRQGSRDLDRSSERHDHERRRSIYRQLISIIRRSVDATLPGTATIAVVSKGDDELVNLGGRTVWHFPRTVTGVYAGYHPADSDAAISHLEEVRAAGAEYLLIPATAFWWLDFYSAFGGYLDARYRRVRDREDCIIYDLSGAAPGEPGRRE